jgi:hypothetical protein
MPDIQYERALGEPIYFVVEVRSLFFIVEISIYYLIKRRLYVVDRGARSARYFSRVKRTLKEVYPVREAQVFSSH